jgi:2-alkyl-3-oxoalkanoate reductase
MKIFVAGAIGAVGPPLVRALGHQVTGMTGAGPGVDHLRELGGNIAIETNLV